MLTVDNLELAIELVKRAKLVSKEKKEQYLIDNGWCTYYNPNYWVHKKMIVDSNRQDYTDYGMPLDEAVVFEFCKFPPFKSKLEMGRI